MSLKAQILGIISEGPATSREIAYALYGEYSRARVNAISAILSHLGQSGAITEVGTLKQSRVRDGRETLARRARIWSAA
jgi:hypothetical protein